VPFELFNPAGLYHPTTYSHVGVVSSGRLVFVAGQVSVDAGGEVVGLGDLVAQARQAYANVATALAAAGATPRDVVKLSTFVVDHGPGKLRTAMEAARGVFGDHTPTAVYLGVQGLARPEYLIEVEAIAVLDDPS
jgi:enamine deaminase RidA (YjgF/YER057c/UK114 family)